MQASQPSVSVSLQDFEIVSLIGKGSFGEVFLVLKKDGVDKGTAYAMKAMNKQEIIRLSYVEYTMTERAILGEVHHPFLTDLKYAFQNEHSLYFILEYC